MKKLFIFITALLMFSGTYAQPATTSLRLRLSDGTLMTVAINGRYFSETGHALTIGDLPRRRIHINVYRFRPYANGPGGKAELVYSGRIKLKKGTAYEGIVQVNRHHLLLKEINPNQQYREKPAFPIGRDQPVAPAPPNNGSDTSLQQRDPDALPPALEALKHKMDQEIADRDKLAIATNALTDSLSTLEVTNIATWFFFDATRMQFVKAVYPLIIDKENLSAMEKVFTEKSSIQQFRQWLQQQP